MNFLNVFFGEESESEIGLPLNVTVFVKDHLQSLFANPL
jgi:hypothetical protein